MRELMDRSLPDGLKSVERLRRKTSDQFLEHGFCPEQSRAATGNMIARDSKRNMVEHEMTLRDNMRLGYLLRKACLAIFAC